jgi:GYF domain 2
MADGYKVKMDDGTQVGPMTLESLEGWFRQGLVRHDNLVQRPGSYNWVPLSEVLARDLKKAPAPVQKAPPAVPAPQPARPRPPAIRPEPAREAPARASAGPALKLLAPLVLVAAVAGGGLVAYRALQQDQKPAETPPPTPDSQELLAAERAKAIEASADETPQLSRETIEFLMAQGESRVLEPHETFRRAQWLLFCGVGALTPAESRELGALMQSVYAALSAKERSRLGAYLSKLKTGVMTTLDEDRELSAVMKKGVLKLPPPRRARLQALFDKAIRVQTTPR